MQNNLSKKPVKYALTFLGFFFFLNTSMAFAADASLIWDPNTEADLAGYRVYYGSSSGNYGTPIDIGNRTTYTVSGLGPGIHYFAVTAYDTSGNESGFSIEVSKATLISSAAPSAGAPSSGIPPAGTPPSAIPTGETLFGVSNTGPFTASGGGGGCGLIETDGANPRSPGDAADMISMIAFILFILLKKSQTKFSQSPAAA